ncbi:uncharacterized protein LOC131606309 [Vicia villosa]|uniref:uncharacterized protein LOC131606309 n=1 Tax=Vicia villosa TaxID=3911 RepID=UPI00273B8257|nr:uncharacterized protein LOC131606309 [Vicia villosa]
MKLFEFPHEHPTCLLCLHFNSSAERRTLNWRCGSTVQINTILTFIDLFPSTKTKVESSTTTIIGDKGDDIKVSYLHHLTMLLLWILQESSQQIRILLRLAGLLLLTL